MFSQNNKNESKTADSLPISSNFKVELNRGYVRHVTRYFISSSFDYLTSVDAIRKELELDETHSMSNTNS